MNVKIPAVNHCYCHWAPGNLQYVHIHTLGPQIHPLDFHSAREAGDDNHQFVYQDK